ncbi:hypothetical protein A5gp_00062 [Alteromonas phage vB_AemP_PT15-A5]|nr:hypothetical protein A5gp_00062 [Alteromonas phage vB_AemP_PT15-A5]
MDVAKTFKDLMTKEEAKEHFPWVSTLAEESKDAAELLDKIRKSGKLKDPLMAYPLLIHWVNYDSAIKHLKDITNLK